MLQKDWAELVCDFEFNLRKMKTVKATDLLENKEQKIGICNMKLPRQENLEKKSGWKTKQVSTTCFRDKRKATGI